MKTDCWTESAQISLLIRGAIALYDREGLDICALLLREDYRLYTAFDELGTALYLIRQNIDEILFTPEESKKV